MKGAPRPAHYKATWNGAKAVETVYACVEHEGTLRAQAEDRATVLSVPPSERDRAGVWCSFCNV